jgi:hypothetical protein
MTIRPSISWLFFGTLAALATASACSSDPTSPSPNPPPDVAAPNDAASVDALTEGSVQDAASDVIPAPVDASTDTTMPMQDASSLPIPAIGLCKFSVDSDSFESAPNDVFTLATFEKGGLAVQCVAIVGTERHTVNLAVNMVTGPGSFGPASASHSVQPAAGGSLTESRRSLTATIEVNALSATAVSGSTTFRAGLPTAKTVSVAFHLPLK